MSRSTDVDLTCDAPPYSLVRACRGLGFEAPEDVRWYRLSRFLHEFARRRQSSWFRPWKLLWPAKGLPVGACSCRQPLPALEGYSFLCRSGKASHLLLGQCCRCSTIFWEEA